MHTGRKQRNLSAGFWKLEQQPDQLAVIDGHAGVQKTYGELRADVERMVETMPARSGKSLVLLLAQNRYECLVAYLAALNSGQATILLDSNLNRELLLRFVSTYRPELIFAMASELAITGYERSSAHGISRWECQEHVNARIHESLALLLSTSGSTGSPKLVRLTHANLQANAESIHSYLQITPEERPITSLPMAYTYGLSVINSHLLAGASIVLSEDGIMRREFWDKVDQYGCTSLAGVPYTYQMLLQMGLLRKGGRTLRTLTQAGGALAEPSIRQMYELALERGFKFYVMYGQTEATARISYVPFEYLGKKIGSIGVAIPNGSMEVDSETGELVYTGPNVMLGYANCREDLSKGDELGGVLRTGDLARRDADGFFYITGRIRRFLKLFGKRYGLDEIEQMVQSRFGFPAACSGRDDLLRVAIEAEDREAAPVATLLRELLALPKEAIQVQALQALPRTMAGKIDYQALTRATEIARELAAGQVTR